MTTRRWLWMAGVLVATLASLGWQWGLEDVQLTWVLDEQEEVKVVSSASSRLQSNVASSIPTSLASETSNHASHKSTCTPQTTQDAVLTGPIAPVLSHWTQFLSFPNNQSTTSTTISSCSLLDLHKPYQWHFPHALQQLYACGSWLLQQQQQNATLLLPPSFRADTPLVQGYLYDYLRDEHNVTIVQQSVVQEETVTPNLVYVQKDRSTEKPYFGLLHHHNNTSCSDDEPVHILVLNRSTSRTLRNAQDIQQALQSAFPETIVTGTTLTNDTSFATQRNHWQQASLVVSPHGGQLAGVYWTRSPCTGLLEVFPHLFHWPHYFGSLVQALGGLHMSVYVSNTTFTEQAWGDRYPKARRRARNVKVLCPQVEVIVEGVRQLLEQRRQCCARLVT